MKFQSSKYIPTHRIIYKLRPFKVDNPWFSGAPNIPTFSDEELPPSFERYSNARRAELIDLSHALATFEALDVRKVVELFGRYLAATETTIFRHRPHV